MVFLATLALLLVVGTRPHRLPDRVSCPFVKTLPQEFGTRPAEVHPFLFSAALRYRSDPAVLLYLVRTPIAIALRTQSGQQARRQCCPSSRQRLKNEKIRLRHLSDLAVASQFLPARCVAVARSLAPPSASPRSPLGPVSPASPG